MDDDSLICMGVITAPHGVRGSVKVKSYTDNPADLPDYAPFLSKDGAQRYVPVAVQGNAKSQLIMQFEGVEGRDAAEKLRGVELYVPASSLPDKADDEFYYDELIGLQVRDAEGQALGEVVALHNFGSGDIIEIALTTDDPAKPHYEMLLFTHENVPGIERQQGYITVVLPEEAIVKPSKDEAGNAE